MQPIKKSLLPNTVTIYNHFRDPDSSKVQFYRTCLQYTRIMSKKKTVNSGTSGWVDVLLVELWVDAKSSLAFVHDEQGSKIKKSYVKPKEWMAMSVEDKGRHWTLQSQDFVVNGEIDFALTEENQPELKSAHEVWAVNSIFPVLDKPGNVHHWEINLV